MRTKTTAALVTALAVVGLLVSLTAAWSGLTTGPRDQVATSDRAAVTARSGPAGLVDPVTRDPAAQAVPAAGPRVEVARSDATRVRKATKVKRSPRPVGLRLGSIDLEARVRPVGVSADGQMRLPQDPRVLGWYRFGMAPGSGSGTTVVAGHLDAEGFGLGPLVGLREVGLEDTVVVTTADGTRTKYVVAKVKRYDREGLPSGLFSRTGPERLHIITCGGAYDPENGGYQKNLVVTAVPVG